jgi:hypothetical protein
VNCWSCPQCLYDLFPYNGIESNNDFTQAIINPNNSIIDFETLNNMVYDPFNDNDSDSEGILSDIDPDQNFLNDIRGKTISNCKYYQSAEHIETLGLNKQHQTSSYLHLNIRSIPRNLDTFITTLNSTHMNIDILAFTETWLKSSNADSYGIPGYTHEYSTRDHRPGEGVSMFINEK